MDERTERVKRFCQMLDYLQETRGIKTKEVERGAGLSNGYLYKVKNGLNPTMDKINAIADFFDVSTDVLIGGVSSYKSGKDNPFNRIPLYMIEINGAEIKEVTVGEELISKKLAESGDFFAWTMNDHTMEPTISMGDRLIVRAGDTTSFGQPALLLYRNTVICRIWTDAPTGVLLIPQNRDYFPEWFTNEEFKEQVKILGEVVEARRSF